MAEEPDDRFKAIIVNMILDSQPEAALEALSRRYRVDTPRLGVGVFKRHSKGVRAVYAPDRKEILAAKREFLYDPFVILHEFYHHIRSAGGKHRGTEKNADRFAVEYIRAFNRVVALLGESNKHD
ncbi:MAG: hypothetical protein E6K90_04440 [Thaumarchaeota archaeon]|nr:MAG: hypothetical protein E6K90_04440 [Nitrososphaerota archaeon]